MLVELDQFIAAGAPRGYRKCWLAAEQVVSIEQDPEGDTFQIMTTAGTLFVVRDIAPLLAVAGTEEDPSEERPTAAEIEASSGISEFDRGVPPEGATNMMQELVTSNTTDENGNPTGGFVKGVGIDIAWQDGPLGRGDDRQEPNGAFVEGVIEAARQRINFYQTANNGKFACRENALAITKLEEALHWLNSRTARREKAGTEGTHVEDNPGFQRAG